MKMFVLDVINPVGLVLFSPWTWVAVGVLVVAAAVGITLSIVRNRKNKK